MLCRKGNGLGLYICKQICEGLNGTISADSVSGLGSRFTFTMKVSVQRSEAEFSSKKTVDSFGSDSNATRAKSLSWQATLELQS